MISKLPIRLPWHDRGWDGYVCDVPKDNALCTGAHCNSTFQQLKPFPYAAEWIAAGHGMDPKRYHPLTHIETGVPIIFLGLHTFVFLRTLPWGMLRRWHEWASGLI